MLHEIDLSRVDLNLLVLFEAVFEERHVGRAATRLHLSASAVSHGIGRLRRALSDPVFLKHPKGVVPTARAAELAAPIADILARVRAVVGAALPFDPHRSTRRFAIGAPDGIGAVVLPPVLAAVRRSAPGVVVNVTEVEPSVTLAALDARSIDLACYPLEELPARFEARPLYEEDFVIAARSGHPLGRKPSLEQYAAARHLLVSPTGATRGFMDDVLAEHGLSRTIALTVPTFLWALTVIADGDLVGTLPRTLVRVHGARFGVTATEPPLPFGPSRVHVVAPRAAMTDAGVAWLMELIQKESPAAHRAPRRGVRRLAATTRPPRIGSGTTRPS
jgi:DNA-binding transcriptional LysR family regulator